MILNAKATFANKGLKIHEGVWFVNPFSGRTARHPSIPPTNEIDNASKRKDRITFELLKPTARMVAISRPRSAMAEYMVLSAPKTAPIAIIAATRPSSAVMNTRHGRGLTQRNSRSPS